LFGFSLIVGLIVLILDILTKYWVHASIPLINYFHYSYPYGGIPISKNFGGIEFSIVHTINSGAAWGMLSEFQFYLLLFRIALIVGIGIFLFFFNQHPLLSIPLSLIAAGAIGNVLDFFIYGHVIDMFHFVFWGYDYPVFNIADSAICIGIFGIALLNLAQKQAKI
jgi:signal peptidase II